MKPDPALVPLRSARWRAVRLGLAVALGLTFTAGGCFRRASQPLDAYKLAADAVHTVIAADRGVYSQKVVERLALEEKVIGASEHWNDEHALPLPAQMLRMSAEQARQKSTGMWYALISSWPLNKQNGPKTPTEAAALEAVQAHPDLPYYGEETVRGHRFFTAVYADRAVSKACVSCHNHHPDSPRRDFVLNETMGALVVRFAM